MVGVTMCLIALLVFVATLIIHRAIYWRLKGVPSLDHLPLVSFITPLPLREISMADWIVNLYKSYPGTKYFGCMDFQTPILVLKDPEIIKAIGVKDFDHFPNHQSFVDDEFDLTFAKNLFSLKDDRWRDMRTILTPTFTANKMKFMFQLVSKCSGDFTNYLLEHPEISKEMDLKDIYTRYTNDVIATAAFGISVDSLKDANNEFYINGKDATDFESISKLVKMAVSRMIPRIMRLLGMKFLSAKSEKFFKSLIAEAVKERDEKGIVRPDMINLLMRARDNKNGVEITIDDITAQALIFFFAGFETSSRLMCFVSHVLSHYPEIQERLRGEIDRVLVETNGEVTYEALSRMKYLDMIIAETLRFYPPQPFTDRVCKKPYELPPTTEKHKPCVLSKNTIVFIPVYAIHHDPDYFPDPETFNPERFSDENKHSISPYTYMPFGFGPRKCIGYRFGLMETKIIITCLMQHFVLKPSPKTTKKITFSKNGSLLRPDCGFWMRMESRNINRSTNK